MGQIAPLLEDWLKKNLLSLGFSGRTGEGGNRDPAPSKKKKKKSEPRDIGTRKGGKYTTTVPSSQLFNAVVGEKKERAAPAPPSDGGQDAPNGPQAPQAPKGTWTEVVKRGTKKTPRAEIQRPAGRDQKGTKPKAHKGQDPKRGTLSKATPKRKPPRAAAVTLTCPPGGYSWNITIKWIIILHT